MIKADWKIEYFDLLWEIEAVCQLLSFVQSLCNRRQQNRGQQPESGAIRVKQRGSQSGS